MNENEYIDLVVCKHDNNPKSFIFRAPAWSHLKKGDLVIVETQKGEKEAIVERSYTTNRSSEELDFILISSGATIPLKKVLKKVTYKKLIYEDENRGDEKNRLDSQT